MPDPYKHIRNVLGSGSHCEVAAGSAGGYISLAEAKRMGIDVTDLLESGTTDTDQPGIKDPKQQNIHMGIRLPSAPPAPIDVRPQTAYSTEGRLMGVVHALITPKYGSQERGSLPESDVTWSAQRTYPYGLKQTFESEGDAKSFVSNGGSVKWYRPKSMDPWESMTETERDRAVYKMIQTIQDAGLVDLDERDEKKKSEEDKPDDEFGVTPQMKKWKAGAEKQRSKGAKKIGMAARESMNPWFTVDEVKNFCTPCAETMLRNNISRIRRSALRRGLSEKQKGWTKDSEQKWMQSMEKGKGSESGFSHAVSRLQDEPGMTQDRAENIVGHHHWAKKGKREPGGGDKKETISAPASLIESVLSGKL